MQETDVSTITKVWEQQERFSLTEAKQIIQAEVIEREHLNDDDPDVCKCILLVGEHSIGKSRIVAQACAAAGVEMVKFHFGATEQEDNAGRQYTDDEYKLTRRAVPEHLPCFYRRPNGKAGVMFFDETMAGYSGHQTILRMMIDRKLVDIDIQPGWYFIGATNPPTIDYASVQETEESLSGRFVYLPVTATAEERLSYWADRMPNTVYQMLLLSHVNGQGLVTKFGSRVWMNHAHTIAKWEASEVGHPTMIKLFNVRFGKEVGGLLFNYLKHGNNQDHYPIRYKVFTEAGAGTWREALGRVKRWLDADEIPLLGATKWDLVNFLRDETHKDDIKKNGKKLAKRVAAFAQVLSDGEKAEIVASLIQGCRDTPVLEYLMPEIRGTRLAKRFLEIYEKDREARKEAEKVGV